MTSFTDIISSLTDKGNQRYSVSVPSDWLQGRTAFGGLSAALVVTAMQRHVADDRAIRSMSVSFVGPVPAGEQSVKIRVLREGGSVSHLQGELICNGDVACSVTASFGRAISTPVSLTAPTRPEDLKTVENCEAFPYIPGLTPEFTQHFEMRMQSGAMPMSGADEADYSVWLRFKEATDINLLSLIAIADMPPLPGLNRVTPPVAGSSLTWYLEFPEDLSGADPEGWWFYDYRCQACGDGYFNNFGTIWAPDGRAAMFTRQVAMVFKK